MGYPNGIDFPFRFVPAGGVGKASGAAKVLSNLKTLVLTALNERLIRKRVGTVGYRQVMRSSVLTNAPIVEALIEEAIVTFEPNAVVLNVEVYPKELDDGTATYCKISYMFKNTGEVFTEEFALE